MTFKDCAKYYPIDYTYVGDYSLNETYTKDQLNSDTIAEALEWNDESAIPFIVYDAATQTFENWYYAFWRVKGYLNETYEMDEFYPATNSESFGWEKVDPDTEDSTIYAPDDELANELGFGPDMGKNDDFRREQVAYSFDVEAYTNGTIFTTREKLERFLSKN